MRSGTKNRATHVTRDHLFGDLGFEPDGALALEFKARILDAILDEVKRRKYRQAQLAAILGECEPTVSNLLRGKIASMSIERLPTYAHRLGLFLEVRRTRNQAHGRRRAA